MDGMVSKLAFATRGFLSGVCVVTQCFKVPAHCLPENTCPNSTGTQR